MKTIKILFEGDSLTANAYEKVDSSLGSGYAFKSVQRLKAELPNINFECNNEAVFGCKTDALLERLEQELKKYKPEIVSLLIGINDVRNDFNLEHFRSNYHQIMELIKKYGCKLILAEPYLCPVDIYHRFESRPTLLLAQEVIKENALKYADAYIPLDGLLYDAYLKTDPSSFFVDGLHWSDKGTDFFGEIHSKYLIRVVRELLEK